jgi:hypothetical protein
MAETAVLKEKSCLWNPKYRALNAEKGYRIGYGYDILKSLKIGYYILKISFLEIFGYRIGYKYPLIYILPVRCLDLIGCSSITSAAQLTACLRDPARYFKTEPTETELHSLFWIPPKKTCLRDNWFRNQPRGIPLKSRLLGKKTDGLLENLWIMKLIFV